MDGPLFEAHSAVNLGVPTSHCPRTPQRWRMMFTARHGSTPPAVSPESITQSRPWSTAFATALASARTGRGKLVKSSSISVAVMELLLEIALRDLHFLHQEDIFWRYLHVQVAADNHDAIALCGDAVWPPQGGSSSQSPTRAPA